MLLRNLLIIFTFTINFFSFTVTALSIPKATISNKFYDKIMMQRGQESANIMIDGEPYNIDVALVPYQITSSTGSMPITSPDPLNHPNLNDVLGTFNDPLIFYPVNSVYWSPINTATRAIAIYKNDADSFIQDEVPFTIPDKNFTMVMIMLKKSDSTIVPPTSTTSSRRLSTEGEVR